MWIRARSGIRGNEMADELAKTAASATALGPEPFLPIDYSVVKSKIERWLERSIDTNWRAANTGNQTKIFIKSQSGKSTMQLTRLYKPSLRIAVGLLTGHAKVNYHLKKMGMRDDPDCRLCGRAEETTSHLICECQSLRNLKKDCLGSDQTIPNSVQKNIHKIVDWFKVASEFDERLKAIF